jgi:RES domain-containing protein
MDELRSIDAGQGPHPPLWWIITPGGERTLCYVTLDRTWSGARGCYVTTATVWNDQGVREIYSEKEWATARLEALAQPVRPQTEIQDVILDSIREEVITPRCGIDLYRETIEDEAEVPAAAGEGRSHG